jgi:DNA-directed RNA polymerase sigma subunit (sigma70/sigma32)
LLTRRYGLNGREGLSLRAAGEALGISKGQAQVLETNALAKLRKRPDIAASPAT